MDNARSANERERTSMARERAIALFGRERESYRRKGVLEMKKIERDGERAVRVCVCVCVVRE